MNISIIIITTKPKSAMLIFPKRSFNIRSLMPLPPQQLAFQLRLLNSKSAPPPYGRVIHGAFTTRENEQIVYERAKERTRDISDPGTPDPPRVLLREQSPPVAGHQREEARAEVSGWIKASLPVSISRSNRRRVGGRERRTLRYYTPTQNTES